MNLLNVRGALSTVTSRVYHNTAAPSPEFPYIVWAEDSQSEAVYGDGQMISQVIEGTIDLFTKTEYDPMFKDIQTALNNAGIPFRLNSMQYEQGAKIYHYEWVWNIGTAVE